MYETMSQYYKENQLVKTDNFNYQAAFSRNVVRLSTATSAPDIGKLKPRSESVSDHICKLNSQKSLPVDGKRDPEAMSRLTDRSVNYIKPQSSFPRAKFIWNFIV